MKIFEIDKLVASLQGYIETKVELVKLDAKDELQTLIAKLFVIAILGCGILLSVFFLSMALVSLLSELFDNAALAYLSVGVLYVLVSAIIYSSKDRVLKSITKSIKENE